MHRTMIGAAALAVCVIAPAWAASTSAPNPFASGTPARSGFFGQRQAPASTAAPAVGTPSSANQFSSASQAQGRCPGRTVVWLNTSSGVYHFAGTRDYGTTKAGAYMCETDATAAGDRASKVERHP